MTLGLCLVAIRLVAADEPTGQKTANSREVLQGLQKRMASVHSISLEFKQERRLKLFDDPLITEGMMLIESPDRIRWETTTPYQSLLLGNGKSIAQFERIGADWKKLSSPPAMKHVMQQMTLMQQGKFDALSGDFDIQVSTGAMTIITLVPKNKDLRGMLASLEVRMLPDLSATREVVMNEPGGDFTKIAFSHEQREVKFPAGTFDLAKPVDIAAVKAAVGHAP
jgi:outer membrane lipoprotein-sorting protein